MLVSLTFRVSVSSLFVPLSLTLALSRFGLFLSRPFYIRCITSRVVAAMSDDRCEALSLVYINEFFECPANLGYAAE